MYNVTEDMHFMPLGALPTVPFAGSLKTALTVIGDSFATRNDGSRKVGAVIVTDGDLALYLVRADFLVWAAEEIAGAHGWNKVPLFSVADALKSYGLDIALDDTGSVPPIVPVIDNFLPVLVAKPERLFVPEHRVFRVVSSQGIPVGWVLNHESLVGSVHTDPPTFRCALGHQPTDPDGGYCHECGSPIEGRS